MRIIGDMEEPTKRNLRLVVPLTIAFIAGMFVLVSVRFVTLKDDHVHYHANFGVFVNGERLKFDIFIFYEEVASCNSDELSNPKIRVHMHDNVNYVVHVHDAGSTWGAFFANLGMNNGDTIFKTNSATYVEDDKTQIRFMLNGEEVQTSANRVVQSEDVLLVSIGNPTDAELDEQYSQITKDAHEYNQKADPAACSGGHDGSVWDKLMRSIGISSS